MQHIKNSQSFLQQLYSIMPHYCDRCGTKHETDDLEIVMNDNDKAVCKLSCQNCGSTYVMHVNSPIDGVVAAKKTAMKSDVSAKEMKKFAAFEPIDSNEVLDVFASMKSINTLSDFENLFKEEKKG